MEKRVEISDKDIKVSRSMVHKGKLAKPGHAFITVKAKGVGALTREVKTEGMGRIRELAIKGLMVKEFFKHFSEQDIPKQKGIKSSITLFLKKINDLHPIIKGSIIAIISILLLLVILSKL